ncbi:alpha-ketoglutarate permease [Bacillus cereus]|uniref:Alpha-ketoglutarate permease n=1 Tax=Bacillus cereus TaxID=1396 RepID=A0A2A8ZU95_BACCE|nr:alpha-ketoglutarate permease [Bacillus cereus]PFE10613.1 alpha-ketoglutarate permease [Bacillus cereus]
MIKTLLAGALLSTGLLAGGAVGAEDVKTDEKLQVVVADKDGNITHKEIDKSEILKDAVPAQPQSTEDVKTDKKEGISANGKVKVAVADKDGNITYKEIDESEIPKDAVPATPKGDVKEDAKMDNLKTVERTEGTGSQEGKMVQQKKEIK